MFKRNALLPLVLVSAVALAGPAFARDAIYDLGAPAFVGSEARMTLSMEFIPDSSSEEIVAFLINAENSSDSLTGPAGSKDYSVLSFMQASPLLDNWVQLPFGVDPLGPEPTDPMLEVDDDAGGLPGFPTFPIPPGTHVLGTLVADLTGIPGGTSVTVAIDGSLPDPTDAVYLDFVTFDIDFVPVSFVNASRTFDVPAGTVIPLPAAAWMALPLLAGLAVYRRKRRA